VNEIKEQSQRPLRINVSKKRNDKIKLLMGDTVERDYRNMYIFAPHGYTVTAVTKLIGDATIMVAFAFCSKKDNFCKKDGRLKCLERINQYENMSDDPNVEIDTDYVITLPFAGMPAVMTIGYAYNLLSNKPDKLKDSHFHFNVNGTIVSEREQRSMDEYVEPNFDMY
jgi:hypothetical protein